MANLYEIDERILSLIDEETGEITDFSEFEKLQTERDKKIENIALWVKNLKADEEAYKNEKQVFEERQKAAKRKRESLEKYLSFALSGNKFKTARVECNFRASQRVEIDDVYAIPEEFLRRKEPDADKAAIKDAIKAGKEIAGARLVDVLNLQVK